MFRILTIFALMAVTSSDEFAQEPGSVTNVPGLGPVINEPRPGYPAYLRNRGIGGSGVFVLHVNVSTGRVRRVQVEQSTGVPLLDRSAVETFGRWVFRPYSTADKVRIPITFGSGSAPKKK